MTLTLFVCILVPIKQYQDDEYIITAISIDS